MDKTESSTRSAEKALPPAAKLAVRPKQARSEETLARMLAAAVDLVMERGDDSFTLADVARRAGISVGSITFRFESKDSLLDASHLAALDQHVGRERAMIGMLLQQCSDLESFTLAYASYMGDALLENGPLLRAFMKRAPQRPEMQKGGQEAATAGQHMASAAFLSFRREIGGPDPERKVKTVFQIIYSAYARQLGLNTLGVPAFIQPFDELKSELGLMALSYLQSPY